MPSGCLDGGTGRSVQDGLLAADALEVVQQLLLDPVLGAGADVVHGLDQQLDEGVGDGAPAQVGVGGEPGQAGRLGVAAQLVGRLDGHALAARLQLGRAPIREQAVGQAEPADRAEPGQLVAQAGDAGPAGAGAQMDEGSVRLPLRRCPALGIVGSLGSGRPQQGVEAGRVRRAPAGHGTAACAARRRRARRRRTMRAMRSGVGGSMRSARHLASASAVSSPRSRVRATTVVAQPGAERLRVGDRRLAEAEQGAYLGALPLGRAVGGIGQQRRPGSGCRHAERARQLRHRVPRPPRPPRGGSGRGRGRTAA